MPAIRTRFLIPIMILAALGAAVTAPAQSARPNILFVFADDHGWQAISAYGSKLIQTPNIDRLAEEGMRFDRCFVTNAICGPSRAVVLTGKHSHLNGQITNGERFDGAQVTMPKLLRGGGYQTAIVGKWHLKTEPTGFDYWEVLIGQGPYYNPRMRTAGGIVKHEGYTTEIITDLALDWLKKKRDPKKPFMLMYQHKAPHRNWAPGPKQLALFDDELIPEPPTLFDDYTGRGTAARQQAMTVARHLSRHDLKLAPQRGMTKTQQAAWDAAYGPKNAAFEAAELSGDALVRWKYQRYAKDYLRCIAAVDENLGRVLAYLDETGLADNTVVVYASDQGWFLGEHGWYDKRWIYEESMRTPFLVRWPEGIKPGSVSRDLVSNLDFAPTFLELAGVEAPAAMQGKSLVPVMKGKTPKDWRKSLYYHYYEYPGAHDVRRHYGVRGERYKLVFFYTLGEWELYDLDEDPDELESVHADPAYATILDRMKTELSRLRKQYAVPEDRRPVERRRTRRDQAGLRKTAAKVKLRNVLLLPDPGKLLANRLDPSGKPLSFGAKVDGTMRRGVVIAQGGGALGFSLYVEEGIPKAAIRNEGELYVVEAKAALTGQGSRHLAAVLDAKARLTLYVDGKAVAEGPAAIIGRRPSDPLCVGEDSSSPVAEYPTPFKCKVGLTDIRLYWGALDAEAIAAWAKS